MCTHQQPFLWRVERGQKRYDPVVMATALTLPIHLKAAETLVGRLISPGMTYISQWRGLLWALNTVPKQKDRHQLKKGC